MNYRLIETKDFESILRIYQQYIETNITFEYELPTLSVFADRIEQVMEEYACIVYERDGEILGFAYAHQLAERAAYKSSAELTVYTSKASKGLGVGKGLYKLLMNICQYQGIQTVYGLVTVGNTASELLHEKLGFKRVGTLSRVAYKNNQWLSLAYFEKQLGGYPEAGFDIRPINQLDDGELKALFSKD